jgi:hypothetical protein
VARLLLALALTFALAAAAQPTDEEEMAQEEEESWLIRRPDAAPPLPDRPLMLRVGASYSRD